MERDIKPTYDELESYVENLQKQLADAQATIAALRQELKVTGNYAGGEAEQIAALQAERDEYKTMYACLTGETYDNPIADLKAQLTQRTAELEAAKRERDVWYARYNELSGVKDRQLNDLQAELERVRAERDHAKKMEVVQKEVADNQTWHAQKLRTLIAANKETKHDAI